MSRPRTIGILTFHRCINYGSYWQAKCLVEGLRARGFDALLLDHDSPRANWAEWRCALQPLLPARVPRSDFRLYARKARGFLAALARLPLTRPFPLDQPERIEGVDLVVVGSDEVWNLRHPWYGGCRAFYGDGLAGDRLVSYAASFGNHDAAQGLDPWWADRLRAFRALSVRDENSRVMLRASVGREADLVLDPCLQFPPALASSPAEVSAPVPAAGPAHVAVYGHSFPDAFAGAVRRWADARGRRLVSIGYRNDWAHEQRIDEGPDGFARLIGASAAVVTNFFHGCVFALLGGKAFACVASPYRSNKVRDLMRAVGTGDRLLDGAETDADIARLLESPLHGGVGRRIAALRRRSDRYLDRALA